MGPVEKLNDQVSHVTAHLQIALFFACYLVFTVEDLGQQFLVVVYQQFNLTH